MRRRIGAASVRDRVSGAEGRARAPPSRTSGRCSVVVTPTYLIAANADIGPALDIGPCKCVERAASTPDPAGRVRQAEVSAAVLHHHRGLNLQACRLMLIREVSYAMRRAAHWAFNRFVYRADGPDEAQPGTGRPGQPSVLR